MSTIYLAWSSHAQAIKNLEEWDWNEKKLSLLVSFVHLKSLRTENVKPENWMLDSGAFSAWNSGKTIDIDELTKESKNSFWTESVSLDVIGDAEGSHKNAMLQLEKGSPAFPVFHFNDPWWILDEYCKHFDKVGLSCRFGETEKSAYKWLDQCFKRTYPHKYHSFGWTSEKMLLNYPFHSADCSSWWTAPAVYCHWSKFGKMPYMKKPNVQTEIQKFYDLQNRTRFKWKREMEKLRNLPPKRNILASKQEMPLTS